MDSDKETVLLVGQNLFFLGRVEMLAEPLGLAAERATTEAVFMDHYTNRRLALVLIDLEGDESVWSQVLENIGHLNGGGFNKEGEVSILAFGPHENVALLERARKLGCDLVLNKGEFNRDLPKILEKLGADLG